MIKQNILFMILLTFLVGNVSAQDLYNQTDSQGKRHGVWKKNFEKTDQIRYQGQFDHGREIGTFKFYKLVRGKSVLSATKEFQKDGTAMVTFLSSKGKVISKGRMKGKLYIGIWTYYHNKSEAVMTLEHYNDAGQLQGKKQVFYKSGQVAEELNYQNGKLEGPSHYYAENGTVVKSYIYLNDQLHGMSQHFDDDGTLLIEGKYKHGKKDGIWKYYNGQGKVIKEEDFTRYSKNPYKQ